MTATYTHDEKARPGDQPGRARSTQRSDRQRNNTAATTYVRKPSPRPDAIKASIDPRDFYQSEIDTAPQLKANGSGWSQNFACPFHADANGSFGVNLTTGAFRCFGCEAQGGSILDYVMLRDGLDLDGARVALAARYAIRMDDDAPRRRPTRPAAPDRTSGPMAPIPLEALPSRPQAHPRHGAPSATWAYKDADGRPLAYVNRFDPPEGRKQFAPLTCTLANGWRWKAPAEPRPLYGLDRLAARPDAPALICEGEKAADAAAGLLPEFVAVTTMNGAQSPQKTDFAPLAGRRVLIWPDCDAPGAAYAAKVADLARAAGAESVSVLDLTSLAVDPATGGPRELPKGWDAADAAADGWTPEALEAHIEVAGVAPCCAETLKGQGLHTDACETPDEDVANKTPPPDAGHDADEQPAEAVFPPAFKRPCYRVLDDWTENGLTRVRPGVYWCTA